MCECVCECVARLFDKWQQFFLHIFFMLFALLSFQLAVFSAAVSLFSLRQACLFVRLSVCVCMCMSWLILWGLLPTVCPLMKLLIFVSKVTYTMCWWRSRAASCRRAIANAPQESYNSSSSSGSNAKRGTAGGGGGGRLLATCQLTWAHQSQTEFRWATGATSSSVFDSGLICAAIFDKQHLFSLWLKYTNKHTHKHTHTDSCTWCTCM